MEEEQTKGIGDYLDILWRRKYWVIIPAIILMTVSAYVVMTMPAIYKSQGVILIESQDIPDDLVRTTITSYADQRIELIRQRLMTTNRIIPLVEKHNLYVEQRKNDASTSDIVDRFKQNVGVEIVQANVTDPASGRAKQASIAFRVWFIDESAEKAKLVTDDVVTEFLSENVRVRTARAEETTSFLKLEGDRMQKEVQKTETEIAEFRDKYSDSLPDLLDYNLAMVQSIQEEIASLENQIMVMNDQVSTMGIQLSMVPRDAVGTNSAAPNQLSTAETDLQELRSEYRSMQSRYSANHPDIQRTKRQIEALEAELGVLTSPRSELENQLAEARSELQSLKQRYASEHPDMKAAEAEVSRIERMLSELPQESSNGSSEQQQAMASNPIYIEVAAKIDATKREVSRMRQRQNELRERLTEYEQRVYKTNQVQRAYQDLTRDHENKLNQYKELRAKQLEAELAQTLESESKGESFVLIEPPRVSAKPEKPDRPKLMAMAFVGSVGAGAGMAILIELLFGGIRGYSQISQLVGKTPLVVIPVITTENDKRKKRTNRIRLFILFIILAIAGIAVIHFYIMNLEVLWFKVMNKLNVL